MLPRRQAQACRGACPGFPGEPKEKQAPGIPLIYVPPFAFTGRLTPSPMKNYRAISLLVLFVLSAIAFTYLLHEFCVRYAASFAKEHHDYVYLLSPGTVFWYAPASILGTIAAFLITYSPRLLPWRTRVLAVLLAIGSVALVYFAAHSNFRLAENEIIFRRLWSLQEETHAYSSIKALRRIHAAGEEEKSTFVIEFYDAPEWTTAVEVIFPGDREEDFLEAKTGKTIEAVTN
jgi:hypothetical protein